MGKLLIALVLASFCIPAAADLVLRGSDDRTELRLLTTPCGSAAVMAATNPMYRSQSRAAAYRIETIPGVPVAFAGCWVGRDGTATVMLEDGRIKEFDEDDFAEEP